MQDKPVDISKRPVEIKMDIVEYQIPAQDSKGHSGRVEFRTNIGLLREIEIMMQDAKTLTGWKTNSEFYRWAVWHGLKTMAQRTKSQRLTNSLAIIELLQQKSQREMADARVMACLDSIQECVTELQMRDAAELIPGKLLEWQKRLGEIDLPYWRDRLQKEFNGRFGHLLKPINLRDYEK